MKITSKFTVERNGSEVLFWWRLSRRPPRPDPGEGRRRPQDLDCVISDLTAQVREAEERAEKAERERDEAERCLVTRAVAANVDIRVCEDDGGGFMVGVHVPNCDEDLERNVPAADVPATLARLLGEVSLQRGRRT